MTTEARRAGPVSESHLLWRKLAHRSQSKRSKVQTLSSALERCLVAEDKVHTRTVVPHPLNESRPPTSARLLADSARASPRTARLRPQRIVRRLRLVVFQRHRAHPSHRNPLITRDSQAWRPQMARHLTPPLSQVRLLGLTAQCRTRFQN
jgi:hypothetical protein